MKVSCVPRAPLSLVVAFLVLVTVCFVQTPAHGADFTPAATPAWVSVQVPGTSTASASDEGLIDLLVDDQFRIDKTVEHYARRVRKIVSVRGVERSGEVAFVFDPAYEHLYIHHLRVTRGGTSVDGLKTATVRALDSEDGEDKHLYDGSRKVVFVLPDVRIGDEIDFAFTTTGANPVFGGRVAQRVDLASARAIVARNVRILTPASRTFTFRVPKGEVPFDLTNHDGVQELRWHKTNAPPVTYESESPAWYDPTPTLDFSEVATWAEAARWAADLFGDGGVLAPSLQKKIRELRDAAPTQEARALMAVRFVQDDLRYLGMELGEHSHRPHPASAVFDQRFGDCKDKVALLVAIMRGLGIEADPVLVNTELGEHLSEQLPSPRMFDHVIARIKIDGRELFVDATHAFERGRLGAARIRFGRGLLAHASSPGLVEIPLGAQTQATTAVYERFMWTSPSATVDVTTTYREDSANALRDNLSHDGKDTMQRSYLEFYAKRFKDVQVSQPLTVDDDEAQNVIITREHYAIPQVDAADLLDFRAHGVLAYATAPHVSRRVGPLAVEYPRFVHHEIVLDGVAIVPPSEVSLADGALSFKRSSSHGNDGEHTGYELRTLAGSVAVADVPAHLELRKAIRDASNHFVDAPVAVAARPAMREDTRKGLWVAGGLTLLVVVVTAVSRVISRRRSRRWSRKEAATSAAGSPASPVTISGKEDAARYFSGEGNCGHSRPASSPLDLTWTEVRLGDDIILAARATCPDCDAKQTRYFRLEARGANARTSVASD